MTEPEKGGKLSESSPSVQVHLGILQSIIERMATNSTSSKSWCITIVSAILVVIADKNKPNLAYIALLPTILFCILDAYYLAMERGFRNSYNAFVKKIHNQTLEPDDLYIVRPKGKIIELRFEAFGSLSVYGFYLGIIAIVFFAKHFVLR